MRFRYLKGINKSTYDEVFETISVRCSNAVVGDSANERGRAGNKCNNN